ncbi:YiiX/YebB-like N1pC/P60 family cysteine hydrolase [Bradyrhizobium sp. DASA03076]|uniref:YiiX/YebB-like N1pC/P60 family cysteine hydrolase n=1 Tax=Bradyrhizobium sp. BLXBL-03 TaxID=3395916 RepID=UPI003F715279
MKRLRAASLSRGDIILRTTTEPVSKAIRFATKSDISHAMIYVQHCSVIDATSQGVHARNTQRLFFDEACWLHVFRLKGGITADQADQVCQFVRQQIGSEYSTKEAIRTVIGGRDQWTRKQFCSRLVAQAYVAAGVKLVSDPNYCAPADLARSNLLVAVLNATETLTDEEAERWAAYSDATEMMRQATNTVLDGARKKDKGIQTIEDVVLHLVNHPADDAYIADLLTSSDFLNLWQVNIERNPWQYDDVLLAEVPRKQREEYCRGIVEDDANGPHQYVVNRGAFKGLRHRFPLATFKLFFELYDLLSSEHRQRVTVARRWLEANGLIAPAIERFHVPHTSEWFATLHQWDPVQAAQTKFVVDAAGREDVCSICGDDPADETIDLQSRFGRRAPRARCASATIVWKSAGRWESPMRNYSDGSRPWTAAIDRSVAALFRFARVSIKVLYYH